MEINESVFEHFISKTEAIAKTTGELITAEKNLLEQMKADINAKQERLSFELLGLASEMNKNKLTLYATRIESYVVQYLLQAPYDAKSAFATHKALFAERHEMAVFLHGHLAEIKQRVRNRINNTEQRPSEKIKVFTYWDNDENLPPIVTICRESLKKHIPSDKFDLIVLNRETYKIWTDFRKEDIKADISQAHFTDILRMKLLERWGGFWIDATDMLIRDFYQATGQIREQEQFIFTYAGSRTGTWFIYSKPNNYIISMISESISLWWEKKNYLTNYFMIHDIIEMLYWVDIDYKNDWDNMLKIHPKNALAVLNSYNKPLNEEEFERLLKGSFVHKLTYKYDSKKVIDSSSLAKLLSGQVFDLPLHSAPIDFADLSNKQFIFSRKDGSLAREMCLDESGAIKNINNNGHNNEFSWIVEKGLLVFKNIDNQATGIFYEVFYDNGKTCLFGYFKNNPKIEFKLCEI